MSSFNQFSYCIFDSSLPHFPLHSLLSSPDYLQFIVECHGNTLLPQFLGMYRLTVDGVETYMVVTRNVFSHRLTVHRKYDLKVGYAGFLPETKNNTNMHRLHGKHTHRQLNTIHRLHTWKCVQHQLTEGTKIIEVKMYIHHGIISSNVWHIKGVLLHVPAREKNNWTKH